MNKKQAAQFLRVSTRAIERYVAKGKLQVRYTKDRTGRRIARFDEAHLKNVKTQLEDISHHPQSVASKTIQHAPLSDKPAIRGSQLPAPKALSAFADLLAAAFEKQISQRTQIVPIPDKLTLSLSEASGLSGLSREFLRKAIKAGKLEAGKRGRGWNIKREDLDNYVRHL